VIIIKNNKTNRYYEATGCHDPDPKMDQAIKKAHFEFFSGQNVVNN